MTHEIEIKKNVLCIMAPLSAFLSSDLFFSISIFISSSGFFNQIGTFEAVVFLLFPHPVPFFPKEPVRQPAAQLAPRQRRRNDPGAAQRRGPAGGGGPQPRLEQLSGGQKLVGFCLVLSKDVFVWNFCFRIEQMLMLTNVWIFDASHCFTEFRTQFECYADQALLTNNLGSVDQALGVRWMSHRNCVCCHGSSSET